MVLLAVPYPALAELPEQSAGQFDDEILVDVSNPSTSPPSTPDRRC
jgi:predicted dinucleotide-binding enzyme